MFLEIWMICVLGIVFVLALLHTQYTAYKGGVESGAELCLELLESNNLIKYDENGQLVEFPSNT